MTLDEALEWLRNVLMGDSPNEKRLVNITPQTDPVEYDALRQVLKEYADIPSLSEADAEFIQALTVFLNQWPEANV